MLAVAGRRKRRPGVLTRLSDRFDGWWRKRKTDDEPAGPIKIETPLAHDPAPVDLLDELKIAVPKRKYPGPRPRVKNGNGANGEAASAVLDETCRLPKVIAKHPIPGQDDCVSGQAIKPVLDSTPPDDGVLTANAARPRPLKKRPPLRPGQPAGPNGPRLVKKRSDEHSGAATATPADRPLKKRPDETAGAASTAAPADRLLKKRPDETAGAASTATPADRPLKKRPDETASAAAVPRPLKKRLVRTDEGATATPPARPLKKRPAVAPDAGGELKATENQAPPTETSPAEKEPSAADLGPAAASISPEPLKDEPEKAAGTEAAKAAETVPAEEAKPTSPETAAPDAAVSAASGQTPLHSSIFTPRRRRVGLLALGALAAAALIAVIAYFGYSYYLDQTTPSAKVARIPAASLPRVAPLNPGVYELYAQERESSVQSEVTIAQGSSLGKSLEELGLGARHQVGALIECLTNEAGLSVVRPGAVIQAYWLDRGKNELGRLEYHPSTGGAPIVVMPKIGGGYWSYSLASPPLTLSAAREGTVTSSLWEAGSKAGLDAGVIMTLSEILASDVDFLTDIKKDDTFQVLYSREYRDGRPQGTPVIDMVKLVNKGKEYEYYRFVNNKDQVGYFDRDGRTSQKTFFVTPLQYKRISSRFTMTRMHPIHKVVRPHQGVDYAAPSGTPISSVADGTVVFAGWNGGYGRLVTIQHDSTYTTMYAHMSSFAPGIKKGSVVKQGDHIGNVGATGTATGPHLDFRLKKNGVFVDPIPELAKQQGKKLEASEYQAFTGVVTTIRERMTKQLEANKLDGTNSASL